MERIRPESQLALVPVHAACPLLTGPCARACHPLWRRVRLRMAQMPRAIACSHQYCLYRRRATARMPRHKGMGMPKAKKAKVTVAGASDAAGDGPSQPHDQSAPAAAPSEAASSSTSAPTAPPAAEAAAPAGPLAGKKRVVVYVERAVSRRCSSAACPLWQLSRLPSVRLAMQICFASVRSVVSVSMPSCVIIAGVIVQREVQRRRASMTCSAR